MKKFKLLIVVTGIVICFCLLSTEKIYASDDFIFSYDKTLVEEQLSELTAAEQSIDLFGLTSMDQLKTTFDFIVHQPNSDGHHGEPDHDHVPGFYWGCCLGPIGVLILLSAHNDDPDAVYQAVFGCLVPSAIFAIGLYTGDPMLIELAIDIFVEVTKK